MKSIINVKSPPSIAYPYVGVYVDASNERTCVLFTDVNTGTCLYTSLDYNDIGEYSNTWQEDRFSLLIGDIRISN